MTPPELTVKESIEQGNGDQLEVRRSDGKTRMGIPVFFVRPSMACFNRSHRFVGYYKMSMGVRKWFSGEIRAYLIDGYVIASNSEDHALREYHRVCAKEKIGQLFEVKLLQP